MFVLHSIKRTLEFQKCCNEVMFLNLETSHRGAGFEWQEWTILALSKEALNQMFKVRYNNWDIG